MFGFFSSVLRVRFLHLGPSRPRPGLAVHAPLQVSLSRHENQEEEGGILFVSIPSDRAGGGKNSLVVNSFVSTGDFFQDPFGRQTGEEGIGGGEAF